MIMIKEKLTKNFAKMIATLALIFLFAQGISAEISVSQSLTESEIAFEDTVQFEIIVEWQGSQMSYLFNKPLTPFIDRLKIGKFSSSVSSQMRDGVEYTLKRYNYSLIPTSAGLGLIDSIYINYLKRTDSLPGVVVTEPMKVLIANPVAKIKEDEEIHEWLLFGVALIVIFGIIFLFRWKTNSQSVEIQLSPQEQFLSELEQVKREASSDMKTFQTQFYATLSKFLVTAYNVNVSLVNIDNLIDELSKAGMSIAEAEQIMKWLKQAEVDKYAPIDHAPGAVVRLESEIRTFFEKQ